MLIVTLSMLLTGLPPFTDEMWVEALPAGILSYRVLPFDHVASPPDDATALLGEPKPLGDAPIDITLAMEDVSVDVYPTLAVVQITMHLQAGSKPENTRWGIPNRVMALEPVKDKYKEVAMPGMAVEGLRVLRDGEPVTFEKRRQLFEGIQSPWEKWHAPQPPGTLTRYEIFYVLPFYPPRSAAALTYTLRSAAIYTGPVGLAQLKLRWRATPEGVFADPAPAQKFAGDFWVWTWEWQNHESVDDAVSLGIPLSFLSQDDYTVEGPSWVVFMDRLIRFTRAAHDGAAPSTSTWIDIIEDLRKVALHHDPTTRAWAASVLAEMATNAPSESSCKEWLEVGAPTQESTIERLAWWPYQALLPGIITDVCTARERSRLLINRFMGALFLLGLTAGFVGIMVVLRRRFST